MKVYISADIEGTCGIVDWEETNLHDPQATYHKEQMTKEVNAACLGANDLGCEDIFVKDAHGSARSINPSMLPENTRILRGWARNPHMMMAGIDEGFDASMFIGYHSAASEDGNPLAHTMNSVEYDYIKLNGMILSEFIMNAYTCSIFKW